MSEFVAQLDKNLSTPELQTLELIGFIPPESLAEVYTTERMQDNLAQRAKILGANQRASCIAVFELNGDEYMLSLDLVAYGDKWYIEECGGIISSLLSFDSSWMGIVPTALFDDINLRKLIVPVE